MRTLDRGGDADVGASGSQPVLAPEPVEPVEPYPRLDPRGAALEKQGKSPIGRGKCPIAAPKNGVNSNTCRSIPLPGQTAEIFPPNRGI